MWFVRTRNSRQIFFDFGAAQHLAKTLASEGTEVRLENKDGHLMIFNASWPTFFLIHDRFVLGNRKAIISKKSTEEKIVTLQRNIENFDESNSDCVEYTKEEFLKLFKGK